MKLLTIHRFLFLLFAVTRVSDKGALITLIRPFRFENPQLSLKKKKKKRRKSANKTGPKFPDSNLKAHWQL